MGWYPRLSTGKLSFFRSIPKVELHRHLEGSLRMDTMLDIARQHSLTVPYTQFHSLVQMQQDEPLTFSNFLAKFQTLRMFYRSPEVIARITREAVKDAAEDGVRYMELRFTPVALSRLQGFSYSEVMDWVIQNAMEAGHENNVTVRLIASVNRHEPVEIAEEVARLSAERISRGIVGLDLAGNEVEFSAKPFAGVFREAHQSGLHITVHAGEWGGPKNVIEAIEDLGAERIGHGVRVIEDDQATGLARDAGIAFEVCLTSNYQTGVVKSLAAHPLSHMVAAGLRATINTDDPGISRITLTDEYRLVLETLGLPASVLTRCIQNSLQSSFLPAAEKQSLTNRLMPQINSIFERL